MTLKTVQRDFDLGEIFILSDKPRSFGAVCFTIVSFNKFLRVLLNTLFVDWSFFAWTVTRGEATLRLTQKLGRKPRKIVSVISGRREALPLRIGRAVYDTGIEKKGKYLNKEIFQNI